MSIASEIEDLNTNLTAAKAAVTAKGGTVGDTGLAGLATEIAAIPGGGGGEPAPGEWGVITYYEGVKVDSATVYSHSTSCTPQITSESTFKALVSSFGIIDASYLSISFTWDSTNQNWTVSATGHSEISGTYTTAQLESVWGISVSNIANNARFNAAAFYSGDDFHIGYYQLQSQADYNALTQDTITFSNGLTISRKTQVRRFVFGTAPTSIPNSFLRSSSIAELNMDNCGNITSVGDYAFSGCAKLFIPLTNIKLPKVTTIGNNFFQGAHVYNLSAEQPAQVLTLPLVTSIGNRFLGGTDVTYWAGFDGMPNLTQVGDWFLSGSRVQLFSLSTASSAVGQNISFGNSFLRSCNDLTQFSLYMTGTRLFTFGDYLCADCQAINRVSINSTRYPLSTIFPDSSSNCFTCSNSALLPVVGGILAMQTTIPDFFPDIADKRKWRTQ